MLYNRAESPSEESGIMRHEENLNIDFAVDLLYPSAEKKDAMKKRRASLYDLPQGYVRNLELEKLAGLISPYNNQYTVNMFTELCDDLDIINYRLDILDDFIAVPKLAPTVKKIIDVMVESDRKNIYDLNEPDSFRKLDEAITAFEGYVKCLDIMHEFSPIYGEYSEYFGNYKWQTLETCANYYGYDWGNDKAHDSLSDCRAVLFCYQAMQKK